MLPTWEIAVRLLLAAVLGAVIGFDRERHTWAAGLRTHMLVCLGAALAMIVSAFAFSDILQHWPRVVLDPSRIAAQVISGIGFLGAGTIMFMHRENVIRGLTTAAGLWTVAAIGLAVGGGMYAAAVIATAVAWVILAMLKPLERRFALRKTLPQVRLRFAGRVAGRGRTGADGPRARGQHRRHPKHPRRWRRGDGGIRAQFRARRAGASGRRTACAAGRRRGVAGRHLACKLTRGVDALR